MRSGEEGRKEEEEDGGEGGGQADIKSNNPHLAGGESKIHRSKEEKNGKE